MIPEFPHGSVIVVEPVKTCDNGAYVIVDYKGETWFRQFVAYEGRKFLKPLNDIYPTIELSEPYDVRGVVVQQTYKRQRKRYL
jgi:SOS-response transcriptional repressor LexA